MSGSYSAGSSSGGASYNYVPQTAVSAASQLDVTKQWDPSDQRRGIPVGLLFAYVADQTDVVNQKLATLKSAGSSLSITDMFEMQMKMNRLSQISEMATAVVSAASGSITSIARNVKS